MFVRFDVGVEQCLARVLGCIEVHDEAVGLQAFDVVVDFREWYFFVGDARPGCIPAVDDESGNLAIVGEEFTQLCLDVLCMAWFYMAGANAVVCVEYAEVEHHAKTFLAESVDILTYDIDFGWRLHGVIVGCLGIPDAEAAVMLGGKAAIGHAGRLGSLCPLAAVEVCRCKSRHGHIGVGPVLRRIRGHIVVNEHAEAQVDKGLLQFAQRLLLGSCNNSRQQTGEKKNVTFHIGKFNIRNIWFDWSHRDSEKEALPNWQ